MIALALAEEAGLEYIYFSAAKLEMYSQEEGLRQLTHLFEYAKSCPKKLMIILDEAEVLFGERGKLSDKALKLLSVLLTYSGTPSNNHMVIAISNKPAVFDTASLSRFGEKIKIGVPSLDTRKQLLNHYARKYFIESVQPQEDKRTALQKMFSEMRPQKGHLHVVQGAFSPEIFADIALKLDGFAGRDIADFMSAARERAYLAKNRTLTTEILYYVLAEKLAQKQEEVSGFVN